MRYFAFDFDGTLIESFGVYFRRLHRVFSELNKNFLPEHRLAATSMALQDLLRLHLSPSECKHAMEIFRLSRDEDLGLLKPFPGISESLNHLLQQNCRLAICTNRDRLSTTEILAHTGLANYFEHIVCIEDVPAPKPSPAGLMQLAQAFSATSQEMAFVGDHDTDMLAARSAGAVPVRASWHAEWPEPRCEVAHIQFYEIPVFHNWLPRSDAPPETPT